MHVPEFNECPPLDGYVDAGEIHEAEVDELLVFGLAEPLDEAVAGERYAEPVGRQPVFREAEVEERGYGDGGRAELLLLFGEVGASDLLRGCHSGLWGSVGEVEL